MQREDLHGSSTTDMPIVGRLKMSDKQTILTQFTRKKNVDFFFDIFRLEKGIFHPNIGEKKRVGIGNITV